MIYSYDSNNHSGRQQFNAKNETITVHLKNNMIMMIHSWKVLHNLASKASLLFQQKNDQYDITQYQAFLPNPK